MVRTYVRKTERHKISEEDVANALRSVIQDNVSLQKAADKYNITKAMLYKRVKKERKRLNDFGEDNVAVSDNDEVISEYIPQYSSKYSVQQVFTVSEELMLQEYFLKSSSIHYGLTYMQARLLAYQYAVKLAKDMPAKWVTNHQAGLDWLKGFMQRHPALTLRKPENTSLGRSTGFNEHNINEFFDNLDSVMDRYKFTPDRIFNVDETGVSTVQQSPKVIAKCGKKQVGQAVSAERGELVTLCGIISATGNTIPPCFVFPRKNYKDHFIKGAPEGSLGLATPSGWMTAELFIEVLRHIQRHSSCTKDNPILLLLDNHVSHIALECIVFAKENGIVLLSFPPHCSHRLQPLDVAVYGPFKGKLKFAFNDWMANHPSQTITIYDVAELSNRAFLTSFTPSNITKGFSTPGIWPKNRLVFSQDDFLGAYVTDRPDPNSSAVAVASTSSALQSTPSALPSTPSALASTSTSVTNEPTKNQELNKVTPEAVRPFPKAKERKVQGRGNRKGKSRVFTDTPEKSRIEELKLAKDQKKWKVPRAAKKLKMQRKPILETSSESDVDDDLGVEVISSYEGSSSDEGEITKLCDADQLAVNDFVLVRFATKKTAVFYVGRVEEVTSCDVFQVQWLRKKDRLFTFPVALDMTEIERDDIIAKLPDPFLVGGTARAASNLSFPVDLSDYNIK